MIIKAYKDKVFPLSDPKYPQYREESSENEESNHSNDSSDGKEPPGNGNNRRSPGNGDDDSSGGGEGPSRNNRPQRNGNNRRPPIKKEETLKKITAIDNMLEPGLVKKYFESNSLKDWYFHIRDIVQNEGETVKKIQMKIIESDLKKLKGDMRNMSENEKKKK